MADNDIEIRIRVNGDAATAGLRRVRNESRALEGGFGRMLDTIGIAPMSLAKFAFVGVPAIAVVGQAAAAAVPLILSLAAAGATVAAGMDGIKAAAAQLQAPMDALKKSVSDTFQRELTPVFAKLAGVFPTLTDGMNMMAVSISQVAGQLVDVISSEAGIANLGEIFRGASNFVLGMGDGLAILVQGMLDAGAAAAPAMASVGTAIGSVFAGIGEQLSSLASNGVLAAAVEGFAATLTGLGQIVSAVFGAIVQMGAAMGSGLGAIFGTIGSAITAISPILSLFAQYVGMAFSTLAAVLNPVIAALAPLIQMIAGAFSAALSTLAPIISRVATALGTALGGAITALTPVFQAITPIIGLLGQIIGDVLLAALAAVQPLLDQLGPIFAMLAAKIVEMMPAIQQLVTMIGEFLVQAIQAVTPLIPVIIDAFMMIMDAVIALIPPLMELANAVLPLLPPIFQAIIDVVTFLVPIIAGIITVLAEVITAIIAFCTQTGANWEKLKADTNNAWNYIKAIPGQVIDFVVKYVTEKINAWLAEASRQWEQFKADAKAKFDEAVESIKTAFDIDWGAIGQAVIDGIKNGIVNGIPNLVAAAGNAAMEAFNAAKAKLGIASPSKLFADGVGKQITAGMVLGIDQTAGDVARATVNAAAGGLSGQFRSALAAARASGKTIFEDYTWKGMDGKFNDDNLRLNAIRGGGQAPAGGGGGGHGHTVTFAGNTSDALATVIMGMIRTGKIQIA